jgi:hypothetical protein
MRAAEAEARRRGRRRIGTEDLLMGLLTEPGGTASRVLGRDIDAARSASARLDTRALEAVGIRAEAAPPPSVPRQRGRLTFTAGARSAFVRAVRLAQADRAGKVTAAHLTAGVLSGREPDDAIALVEAMGVEVASALERATTIIKGTD